MFTLVGAVIGFGAMLAARGKAGIAAALAVLGLVFGMGASVVVLGEFSWDFFSNGGEVEEPDWQMTKYVAGVLAAAPGVLGALFGRRD